MVDVSVVDPNVVLGALVGAIHLERHDVGTSDSRRARRTRSSAATAAQPWPRRGSRAHHSGWTKTLIFIVLSPLIGMFLGWSLMVGVMWIFHTTSPARVDRYFRAAQLASLGLLLPLARRERRAEDDGIIVGLLVSSKRSSPDRPACSRISTSRARTISHSGWRSALTVRSRSGRSSAAGGSCSRWNAYHETAASGRLLRETGGWKKFLLQC